GTRDSIMVYLLHKGLEPKLAFNIMEITRKGKSPKLLTPEMQDKMRECGVEQWYIDSCMKIKYMFPKAHASAYVISAVRLAWFKIYRPLEFYSSYLTVRAGEFDAESVLAGRDAIQRAINDLKAKGRDRTAKEDDALDQLMVSNEAVIRGIGFLPIDINKSDAKIFQIEDGKIRLPFIALKGLGESAAEKIVAAREAEPFSCIEDAADRAGLSKTIVENLTAMGAFGTLPKSTQFSFFE
ncbi:MAG: PolC-type DNA polymerase III, partial [Clostridia bacterium]|nr:PolC-type DNA polymerase III [Clostridia bacterium]